jgi:hypothetical protein
MELPITKGKFDIQAGLREYINYNATFDIKQHE